MFQKAIDTMAEWLSKQQTQTVVLLLNLAVLWGFIWWAVDRGVPQHIEMIQKGYDRQETAHEKQLNRVIDLLTGKHPILPENVAKFQAEMK